MSPSLALSRLPPWLKDFSLVMFDFDGVLVDSERAHYEAYREMCAGRGVAMQWDFLTYCRHAHASSEQLRTALVADYPSLLQGAGWPELYAEKTEALLRLYRTGAVQLQEGVTELLEALEEAGIARCVVTHSADTLVELLREQHPILNTIPHWITRGHYSRPKPAPDCYQLAMERLLPEGGQAVGIEDTPRGLEAILASGAAAVWVRYCDYSETSELMARGVRCISSLADGLRP